MGRLPITHQRKKTNKYIHTLKSSKYIEFIPLHLGKGHDINNDYLSQHMRFCDVSHSPAINAQASLHKWEDSLEPSLFPFVQTCLSIDCWRMGQVTKSHVLVWNLGWSIVHIKGSTVVIKKNEFLPLMTVFVFANSVDPDKMLHYAAFHLVLHYLSPAYKGLNKDLFSNPKICYLHEKG